MPKRTSRKASAAKISAPVEPPPRRHADIAGTWVKAAIILFGVAAYYNSLLVPFIFDDRFHIVENAKIRALWPPWPYLLHSSRPVIYLSVALNYAIGQLHPLGYHLLNLAVHIAAALTLYGVLRRTFLSNLLRERFGPYANWLSGFIALIWLVHPIQTESVTYTIQRGESLMGLFYLLVLYCVIRGGDSPRAAWWQAAGVASFCLGLGCKGVILTAPVIVALYDRIFLSKSWGESMRRRWGLYAALAAACLLYPLLLAQAPAEWKESAGFAYAGAAPLTYAMTQAGVILHYLQLVFWPAGLCLDYGWPAARSFGEVFAQLLMVGALLAATIWAWRRKPALGYLGAWFFIILIPTSSFIPIADLAAEHRMYLSLAAVVTLVVAGAFGPVSKWAGPMAVWMACGLIAVLLTTITIRRNADYASDLAIWQDTVDKRPGNPRGQYDLGRALESSNQTEEAIAHYQKAVEENPNYVDALNNLGHVLALSGKAPDSQKYLEKAVRLRPDLPEAHLNLGYALAQQGKIKDAIAEWREALRIKPDFAEVQNNLGIALALEGKTGEAIEHWEQALKLAPDSADTHNNLAYALSQNGRTREAMAHYEEALRLRPEYAQALGSYAKLLATLPAADGGDPSRAIDLASRACAITGNRDAAFLETLAMAYAAANRFPEAAKSAEDALAVARAAGQLDAAREMQTKLEMYRRGTAR
ncbi:MAG: tetratricopeptide repeat protein [Bryobacteraceae bacterium]